MDVDSGVPLATASEAVEYGNMRLHNLYRPWKSYRKVPRYASGRSAGVVLRDGYFDIATPLATGAIKFYSAALDVTQQYGILVLTYYITLKNRR